MLNKEKTYPQIGKVVYTISTRAKRINLSIVDSGIIKVSIPKGVSFEKAEEFLLSKREWIININKEIEVSKKDLVEQKSLDKWNKPINYPLLGVVTYVKSSKSKSIAIKIIQKGVLKITVPYGITFNEAEKFLLATTVKITQAYNQIADTKTEQPETTFVSQWESEIDYPSIGKVTFSRSSRASRLSISVKQSGLIKVTAPYGVSFEDAEQFLTSRTEWILKSKKKLEEREVPKTIFSPTTDFSTKFRKLNLIPEDRSDLRLNITASSIDIRYPDKFEIENEVLQASIRKAIEHAWKVEAHECLPQRIKELAQLHGFEYTSLQIKNTRTFWGKCYSTKAITLSIHLMHLPDHLIDYVILHELCHTIHMNHGPAFWKLMNQVCDNKIAEFRKEIKKHSTRTY